MAAEPGISHSEPGLGDGRSAWWLERRPKDGGRTTLVHDGQDVTPPDVNVRTRVHEYGGGAWLLHGDTAFFSNFDDQRLYRLDPGRRAAADHARAAARLVRYADGRVTPTGG